MCETKRSSSIGSMLSLIISFILSLTFMPAHAQEIAQASMRPCSKVRLYVDQIYINEGGDDGFDGDAEWHLDMFVNGALFEFDDDNVDTGETKPSRTTDKFDQREHFITLENDATIIEMRVGGYEYDDTSPNDPLPSRSWSHGAADNWGIGQQRSQYVFNLEFAYTIFYTISCWTPPFADLQITLTDNQNSVRVGGTLQYRLVVANNGPSAAQNVTSDVNFSNAVTFLQVNHSGCRLINSTLFCEFGSLAAYTSAIVDMTVQVNHSSSSRITTTASASASTTTEDPNTSNNTTAEDTNIYQQALFLPIVRR